MLKIVKVLDKYNFICIFALDSSAERGATATRTASVCIHSQTWEQ